VLRIGAAPTVLQFVELKSDISSRAKSALGMSHEILAVVAADVISSTGAAGEYVVQTPPRYAAATSLRPSADEATDLQARLGALFEFQLTPELVEV
jgi:hypothetical protein